ncbi:HipA domain-containing protein [Pigmentiphaga sp. NML080357]|uniref:HipA domain-containing protein n=1 Tax=Pigmentiphaga sp. NML080357 TaxID=2008675 RepID=UPI0018E9EAE5|nr:HipA domain-containing protein [Pigmentiphaga sp. NML080357]
MMPRTLIVSINEYRVGELREQDGLWAFQYSEAWLAFGGRYPLSPHLPLQPEPLVDGATVRPVQWYFDNLLPEEGQRTLLAADARLDTADAFGLLAYYGAETAGSLALLPPGAPQEDTEDALRPLSDKELSQRIRRLPRVALTHGAVKRMSLAGAQHKLAVVIRDDVLYEPSGTLPSLQILKPEHPDPDYPHCVVNEWFVMRLAAESGLIVPAVHRRYVPEPVYIVDRFDRALREGKAIRLHAIDACQLLGLDRSFKYAQGSMENLARLAAACRSPAVARTRLFSWLVFNMLTGNGDAHLKNLSFLVSATGVQPAPHYDLVSTSVYESRAFDKQDWPHATRLAWPILDAQRFSQIDRRLMIAAGGELGINRGTSERLLDTYRRRVVSAADSLCKAFEAEATGADSRRALAAGRAGEARCVRAIVHTVIREMAGRLA